MPRPPSEVRSSSDALPTRWRVSAAESTIPEADERPEPPAVHDRRFHIRAFEVLIALPTIVWLVWQAFQDPTQWQDQPWSILLWVAAVAVAELLPVPTNVSMGFS